MGARTKNGAVREWLETVALPYEGDDCLVFPFHRTPAGHGHISEIVYGTGLAHVWVLTNASEPKPGPQYECCHACGNGHLGCVNKRHLYWGTRSENMQDRIRHGVLVPPPVMRGEANNRATLTTDKVRAIRAMLATGQTQTAVGKHFKVSTTAVNCIHKGRTWAWLD